MAKVEKILQSLMVPVFLYTENCLASTNEELGAAACFGVSGSCLLFFVGLIILNIALMVWVVRDAKARGAGSPIGWLILVMITGLLGLIIYFFSRPKGEVGECTNCRNKRLLSMTRCPYCGATGSISEPSKPVAVPADSAGDRSGINATKDGNRNFCTECGSQNETTNLFCRNCGAKLASTSERKVAHEIHVEPAISPIIEKEQAYPYKDKPSFELAPSHMKRKNKLIIVLAVVLVLIVGSWFSFNHFVAGRQETKSSTTEAVLPSQPRQLPEVSGEIKKEYTEGSVLGKDEARQVLAPYVKSGWFVCPIAAPIGNKKMIAPMAVAKKAGLIDTAKISHPDGEQLEATLTFKGTNARHLTTPDSRFRFFWFLLGSRAIDEITSIDGSNPYTVRFTMTADRNDIGEAIAEVIKAYGLPYDNKWQGRAILTYDGSLKTYTVGGLEASSRTHEKWNPIAYTTNSRGVQVMHYELDWTQ